MSDDHDDTRDQSSSAPSEPPASDRWGDPSSDARKAELAALFERQALVGVVGMVVSGASVRLSPARCLCGTARRQWCSKDAKRLP